MNIRRAALSLSLVLLLLSAGSALPANADPSDCVVKIFVNNNAPDHYRPWQSNGIDSATGSGVVIEGERILTNAHVVSHHTFIQVKRRDDPRKFTARVEAIAHDCDLALLKIVDADFFKGIVPPPSGEIPRIGDTVAVVGYPQGGEQISVTQGVVSRIEVTEYAHATTNLLAVQVDAAINPGNSGGPVFRDGNMVGIAMQAITKSQNIGYFIPRPIVDHFLEDLKDGRYDGFPFLSCSTLSTENPALRDRFGLREGDGGLLVSFTLPFAPDDGLLLTDDILLSVDGTPVALDGTYAWRDTERLAASHLVSMRQMGDTCEMTVLRERNTLSVSLPLKPWQPLVKQPFHFAKPPYLIFGGLVFSELTNDLLRAWGDDWQKDIPANLKQYIQAPPGMNRERKRDIVLLMSVLPDDINIGYHALGLTGIEKVNGRPFGSFEEFVRILADERTRAKFIVFTTEYRTSVVLPAATDEVDRDILKRYDIPARASDEALEWFGGR